MEDTFQQARSVDDIAAEFLGCTVNAFEHGDNEGKDPASLDSGEW